MLGTSKEADVSSDTCTTIQARGQNRPALKLLNRHVRNEVSFKWHDLGLELLEQEDERKLSEIQRNNPHDVSECCKEMFQLWLSSSNNATWNRLIQALRDIGLKSLSTTIEGMLIPKRPRMNPLSDYDSTADDEEMVVNFKACKDAPNAFALLFATCQKATKDSEEEFYAIRNSCITRASEPLRSLLKNATGTQCLFEILAENNKYCNWMDVRFLTVIASACGNTKLQSLIQNYTNVIYSKTLREVWNSVPHYSSVRNKYYSELKATFSDKDPDNMTVEELIRSKPRLAKEIAVDIAVVEVHSIVVTWLIPTDEVYQAYLSFLTVPQESRKDELIQFGIWMAHLPQNALQKHGMEINCGAVSRSTLVIGYYHGLLLRDIDADLVTDKMCFAELLTIDEQSIISSGHSVHHRNWLLLEHVQCMRPEFVLEFSVIIQEEWSKIGSQLITALNGLLESPSTKPVLSACQCGSRITSTGSTVLTLYFHLIDQLEELLQSCDCDIMMEHCRGLMASEKYNIKLFTSDQLKALDQYRRVILLRMLSFTWTNCSILRVLVSCCKEAVKLLDKFESDLDSLQLIACYPIPCFSVKMIPSDTSTYTILAVRCKVELYESSLQYIYDVQSVMIEKCDITQHCLQLLAVRSDPTILYWTIPKCVVYLINTNVPLHSEYLYSREILEVLVYPDLLLTTGDDVCYGSLVFECADTERNMCKKKLIGFSKDKPQKVTAAKLGIKAKSFEELRKINEKNLQLTPSEGYKVWIQKLKDLMNLLKEPLSVELHNEFTVSSELSIKDLVNNIEIDLKKELSELKKQNIKLKNEIESITRKLKELLKDVYGEEVTLKSNLNAKKEEIKALKKKNKKLTNEVIELRNENVNVAKLKKENEELRKNEKPGNSFTKLRKENEVMKIKINQLDEEVNEKESELKVHRLMIEKYRKELKIESEIGKVPDASKCEVTIPTVTVNKEATLVITLRDKNNDCVIGGSKHILVSILFEKSIKSAFVKPMEVGDGRYEASFTAIRCGYYMISVMVDKQHNIFGSPYKIQVDRDFKKITEKGFNPVVTHYGKNRFRNLRDVAIGPNGEVVITDYGNSCLVVLDDQLNLLAIIGKGCDKSSLVKPDGVTVTDNVIAVSDRDGHQVKKYSLQGEFLSVIGYRGSDNGEFNYPRGLAFNSKKLLYVIDTGNYRVQVFEQDNTFAFLFGNKGTNPGQFKYPVRIKIDLSDNVLITDVDANCIHIFSPGGQFIKAVNCNRPYAIAISSTGYLITSHDGDDNKIRVWTSTYQLITQFGKWGYNQGCFNGTNGIAINTSGTIYVVERFNNRLQVNY